MIATSLMAITGGFAPPSWTPASLGATLKLWLDSDLGITQAGGFCSAWADQSGNGNDVSQAVGGAQPAVTANGLNGHQTLTFDSAKFLTNASVKLTADGADKTFFAAFKATSNGAGRLFVSRSAGNGAGVQISPTIALTDNATFNDSWTTPITPSGNIYIYQMLLPSGGAASVSLNNVNQPLSTTTVPAETGAGGFVVGSYVGQPLDAELVHISVCDTLLSAPTLALMYSYLSARIA